MQVNEKYRLHYYAFHGLPEIVPLVKNATAEQLNSQDPYGKKPIANYSTHYCRKYSPAYSRHA